jgi:hypothetical protein
MPIYLVLLADLSTSLVRARGEDDLIDTFDQAGNPEGHPCGGASHGGRGVA